jgi:asparagine synthase (glutamine-hydrolysing)
MKLQLGLLNSDGETATRDDCLSILGDFLSWPSETAGEIADGPVAIAYRGDRITPEEEYETQPLRYGPYIMTFDGRLDNRDDLTSRLGITNQQNLSDPLLVAKAYEKFGDAAFPDLIGEFAISLWCRNTRSLRLIRSVCGSRPLYYIAKKDRLVWSSNFAHLVRTSQADLTINEAYLLEYLVSQPHYQHTPLCSVQTVPPGRSMCFTNRLVEPPLRLWQPHEIPPIHFHSDAEYEERLRQLLSEALRVKLRAKNTVFSELSGGLDSSALVLTADEIHRSTNQPLDTLKTISCVYDESETCDERYFIRCVDQKRGTTSLRVSEENQAVTLGLKNIEFSGLPTPFDCFAGRFTSYANLMHQYGSRVLLSGEGGDHLFWSICDGTPVVADYMKAGNLLMAHRECVNWSRITGVPYFHLAHQGAALALGSQYQPPPVPIWLGKEFRTQFASTVWDATADPQIGGKPSFRAHFRLIEALYCQFAGGYSAHYGNIYVSYPYTYRPLVEFCLGLPAAQFLRNGETRSLMRRTLHDVLPPQILQRRSKASADEPIARALSREWGDVGDPRQWEICRRGFVDSQLFQEELRLTRLGILSTRGNLLRAFSLERWLRSLSTISRSKSTMRVGRSAPDTLALSSSSHGASIERRATGL